MQQVIYIDELIFINTAVNYFLLLATSLIMKTSTNKWRILLGAFSGGLFSFSIFLPDMNFIISILFRILTASILVLITFKIKSFLHFLKSFFILFLSTFLFAGMMSAIWLIFKSDRMVYTNCAIYFDINIYVLIISSVICYILIFFAEKFFKSKTPQSICYYIEIVLDSKTAKGNAMLDTGNNLKEMFTGFPVVIITKNLLRDIIPKETLEKIESFEIEKIDDESFKKRVRIINCSTVNGTSALVAFRPDSITVKNINSQHKTNEVFLGISKNQTIINEKFDALLSSEIFERS